MKTPSFGVVDRVIKMNRKELEKYYEGYEKPENKGYLNAEIFCLEGNREKLTHTPEDLEKVCIIDNKLEYLRGIRNSEQKTGEKHG